MSNIEIFNNPKFGSVRSLEIDNEPWFVGKDIAEALGYTDITHTITDHVDKEDRVNSKTQGQNDPEFGQRGTWLINESGLYSLVLSSKLPEAREFKQWIAHDVLPKAKSLRDNTPVVVEVNDVEVIKGGSEILVDSRSVAENFGKEHGKVLRTIDDLVSQNRLTKTMFHQCNREYRGQQFRYFAMNRDGFSLLVMGFTGKEALQWKLKYIAAFNEMEGKISEANVVPQTLPEALRAYADEVEAHEHTKQVLEIAKPKAKVYDEFVDIDHTIGFRELSNELKVSEKELRGMLDDNGWYYKAGHGKRKPYKWVITEGYMKAGDVKSGEWSGVQYRFTMKGRDEVTKMMEVSA